MSRLSIFDAINNIAKKDALETLDNNDSLELYLKSWWSSTYNRPLKDPILQDYSIYELAYEFYDKIERKNARELHVEQENDKIEDDKIQQALDWAEEEERKERELLENAKNAKNSESEEDEEKWMLEQLKKERGDDFGEDISLDFDN